MKRKKISIQSLQVSSFITNAHQLRAGLRAIDDTNPDTHDVSHGGDTRCGTEDIGCEETVHNCAPGALTQ